MITRNIRSSQIAFRIAVGVLLFASPFLPTTLHAEDQIVQETGITYCKGGDFDLKLDLARPAEGKGPFPAIVFIFGGGWSSGSRTQCAPLVTQAAGRGYVAVTVDYRLTSVREGPHSKYPFPAQIYDVKCAVRWLRANAERCCIDPEHIGAVGWSSGGHLALMLGLTNPSDGFEGDCGDMRYSSRVQAVVSLAGPTELVSWNSWITIDLLGGSPKDVPEQYRKASPLTYVRKDSPPILTIQGDKDITVPLTQAELLDAKMKEVGARHTLIVKEGSGHQLFYDKSVVWDLFDFLDKNLKAGK
jgi:acetyl esterase/lipase